MDVKKTGEFLAVLRHGKGLTQEQLATVLGVTNKTISRWETGTYMPPVEALDLLSKFYGVTINEILSGERAEGESYKSAAEENIKAVLKSSAFTVPERVEYYKRKWKKEHLFELIIIAAVVIALFIAGKLMDNSLGMLSVIAALAAIIMRNNRMMIYVERHVYDDPKEQ